MRDRAAEATALLVALLKHAGANMDRNREDDARRIVDLILDQAVEEARNERKGLANQRTQTRRTTR